MANTKTVRTTKKTTKKVVKAPVVQKETVVPVVEVPKEETTVLEVPVEPAADKVETTLNNLETTEAENNVEKTESSENDNPSSESNENLVEKKLK